MIIFLTNFGNNKHEINRKVMILFQIFCTLSVFGFEKTKVMLFSSNLDENRLKELLINLN